MGAIRIYKEDEDGYKNLELFANIMNRVSTDTKFEVGETYFDFGRDWKWITVYAKKGGREWQALYPKELELIVNAKDVNDILYAVKVYVVDETNRKLSSFNLRFLGYLKLSLTQQTD